MNDRAVVIVRRVKDGSERDMDIPLDISLHEFIKALYSIYGIKTVEGNMGSRHLCAENPIILLKGNKLLRDYGLHEGSILYITE